MRWHTLSILLFIFLLPACSTPERVRGGYSPEALFNSVCAPGRSIQSVEGHLWLKAKSKEVSGQFPADVTASLPAQLRLEITNFLGGTEALILVDGQHYEIRRGNQEKESEGYGSWGGIPLRWATDLFLGKVPCPNPDKKWKLNVNKEGDLVVETGGPEAETPERFTYQFREYHNQPWADHLVWEKLGERNDSVEFKFDDPEDSTLSPKKWEAKSSAGSVKVRWRSRKVTLVKK